MEVSEERAHLLLGMGLGEPQSGSDRSDEDKYLVRFEVFMAVSS